MFILQCYQIRVIKHPDLWKWSSMDFHKILNKISMYQSIMQTLLSYLRLKYNSASAFTLIKHVPLCLNVLFKRTNFMVHFLLLSQLQFLALDCRRMAFTICHSHTYNFFTIDALWLWHVLHDSFAELCTFHGVNALNFWKPSWIDQNNLIFAAWSNIFMPIWFRIRIPISWLPNFKSTSMIPNTSLCLPPSKWVRYKVKTIWKWAVWEQTFFQNRNNP